MTAYYNEWNKHGAAWLRNLIDEGLIPAGDVDDRDIRDVTAADIRGYTQVHLFAGIGLWPCALRLAGWPDDRPVWSVSCPCQPFSGAGKGDGFDDERHLWPAVHWLARQHRPDIMFGEQVASPDGLVWLDLVSSDLEGEGYACGPLVFPSCGIGAPNIRHRIWWVADANSQDISGRGHNGPGEGASEGTGRSLERLAGLCSTGAAGRGLGHSSDQGLPDTKPQGMEGPWRRNQGRATQQPSGPFDPWRQLEWLDCTDGKRRPTQPGIFPLAPRYPGDVAKLRAYGNAINPEVAAEVIRSYLDITT
jgi:DNA (cytosine-5)-methyltransferase 1